MKGLKKTFTKKVTSVVLSVAMIFTGISVTPQTIRAEDSITATNGASVSMKVILRQAIVLKKMGICITM